MSSLLSNNNDKNCATQEQYDSFNTLVFSNNIKIIGKFLYKFQFFELTKHLPGDIVELGVFKGSGIASFLKFLEIYSPNSNKKVIGFDLFDSNNTVVDKYDNGSAMKQVYSRCKNEDLTLQNVETNLENVSSKFILIEGDVCITTKNFCDENPGFRISLLYVDLDLKEPVYESLKNLWNRILPGGYIIFDEYEFHKFDESSGVEKFLQEFNIQYNLITTQFTGPTAYLIKKK